MIGFGLTVCAYSPPPSNSTNSTVDINLVARSQVDTVNLEPRAKIVFKPGDMHVMIVGLKQPLTRGQTFSLILKFEKAGSIDVTVPIEGVGAMRHDDMGSMR